MPLADMISVGNETKPASLEALLQQKGGKFSPLEALEAVHAILQGIKPLHDAGLQHGDPSPRNVLLLGGRYRLSDLGLVRSLGNRGIWNAPFYPQSRTGKASDDLYAVTLILFVLIFGEGPSDLDRRLDFCGRQEFRVFKIIAKGCSRNPELRYTSAADDRRCGGCACTGRWSARIAQTRPPRKVNSGTGSGAAHGRR